MQFLFTFCPPILFISTNEWVNYELNKKTARNRKVTVTNLAQDGNKTWIIKFMVDDRYYTGLLFLSQPQTSSKLYFASQSNELLIIFYFIFNLHCVCFRMHDRRRWRRCIQIHRAQFRYRNYVINLFYTRWSEEIELNRCSAFFEIGIRRW